MSLRSFIFETANAPRRCLVLLMVLIAMLLLTLFEGTSWRIKTDGPTLCLESPAKLRQQFAKDTVVTELKAGESIIILGIKRSSYGQEWLVKTRQGNIGWIDAADLTNIPQVVTDGADKGDTVSISADWHGWYVYNYIYTNNKGEEKKRSTGDFMPLMEDADDLYYDRDAVGGICTQKKFENKTLGKSLVDVNKNFGEPELLRITPEGIMAQYSWKAFDPSSGKMWLPNVTFGKDSIATSVEFARPTERAAGWLKKMPLASTIIDCPLTTLMIRTGRYLKFGNPLPSTGTKILIYGLFVIVLFSTFCWMFCTQVIPTLLMGWLIKFPKVFFFLNDHWLRGLIFSISLVSTYIWMVVMMAWGMFPFWNLILIIISWYSLTLAASPLCEYPHIRCPKCRHLYTIRFDHEVLEKSEIKTGEDIVRGKLLGSRTDYLGKTWTQITTTRTDRYGRESRSSYNTNERHHYQNYNTYQFIDYKVTYRLDHYREYYKCSCCGLVEETTSVRSTELHRERIGSHVADIAGEKFDRSY